MPTTAPAPASEVRANLALVTAAAVTQTQDVVSEVMGAGPQAVRSTLFATVPLIVRDFADAAAELATDWYAELRDFAAPSLLFTPEPFVTITDADIAGMVARTTSDMRTLEEDFQDLEADVLQDFQQILADLESEVQKEVAGGFRDTTTRNSDLDPSSVGWRRYVRPDSDCKFCRMLADRGAVYNDVTVHFAAHPNCLCLVGPSFDENAPKADVMQYLASRRNRTAADRAKLRAYLNANYAHLHG